jgi:hypothetical protein
MAPSYKKNGRTLHPRPRSRAQKRVHEDTAIHDRMARFQRIGGSIGRHVQFMLPADEHERGTDTGRGSGDGRDDDRDDDVRVVDFAERVHVNMHTHVIDTLIAVVQRTHLDLRRQGKTTSAARSKGAAK